MGTVNELLCGSPWIISIDSLQPKKKKNAYRRKFSETRAMIQTYQNVAPTAKVPKQGMRGRRHGRSGHSMSERRAENAARTHCGIFSVLVHLEQFASDINAHLFMQKTHRLGHISLEI